MLVFLLAVLSVVVVSLLVSVAGARPHSAGNSAPGASQTNTSDLPKSERRLLRAAHNVTVLPSVIPTGGVALSPPGAGGVGPTIYVQPATPSSSDVSASSADAAAENDVGGPIINTVFGDATMLASLVPAGDPVPADAVLDRPVWIVTLADSQPGMGNPTCAMDPSAVSGRCSVVTTAEYTTMEVVIDGASGQMLVMFPN